MTRLPAVAALALGAVIVTGCKPEVEAPSDKGVCYHMIPKKGGGYAFNEVSRNLPSLEYCAAALERMRLHFVALGGSHSEIGGSYQGQFLFVQKEGIFTSAGLNKTPYLVLVRSGDGRLVAPGTPVEPQQ